MKMTSRLIVLLLVVIASNWLLQCSIADGCVYTTGRGLITGNESGNVVGEIIERQDRLERQFKSAAERRLKEYYEASIESFVLSAEPDRDAVKIITMHMRWDVNNGEERTRKMLSMYSDDMAAYLCERYPDVPIQTMCIIWEVPTILKNGPVAKYEYSGRDSKMYRTNASGILY